VEKKSHFVRRLLFPSASGWLVWFTLVFSSLFSPSTERKKKAKEKAGHCGEMLFNDGVVLPWVPCV
jgi:hypothetical protein